MPAITLVFVACSTVLTVLSDANSSPRPDRTDTTASDLAFLLAVLTFAAVGFLIVRQQPRNAIGWLLGVNGLLLGWLDLTSVSISFAIENDVGTRHDVAVMMALTNWTWVPTVGLLAVYLVLLFPDGHLPSARWRWLPWTAAATMTVLSVAEVVSPNAFDTTALAGRANPLAVGPPTWVGAVDGVAYGLFAACMLASAAAAVGRFRRSRGVERLQMKWLVFAGAFIAVVFGVLALAGLATSVETNDALGAVAQLALALAICAVPAAIGAAVLKHGLYEIDVVINKAVVLGVLASFITAVYVAIVVGLGRLVGGGDQPNLALSIAATAVVAVAFQPVRERVQRFANRLVYGERATPYEVLADFADRVGGAYDAEELLPRMARNVAEGLGAARVEVWLADGSGLVREAAWPEPSVGAGDAAAMGDVEGDRVVEVRHHGELLGALAVVKPAGEALTPPEDKLLADVAAQAGLVMRNVRLIEDLRSSRERLVTTQEDERRRLERNLHDGAQQSLVSVTLMLSTTRARLSPELQPTLGPTLDQVAEQLRLAIEELRELARGIHPAILTERGIGPAVRSLAERSPVPVEVDIRIGRRPAPVVESALYFVAAEALTNVAKYAHAAQVIVTLTESRPTGSDSGGELVLEVHDDGIGGADPSRGSGLAGLEDRAGVVDGTITVHSPPGAGTTIRCAVPLRDRQPSTAEAFPSSVLAVTP